jgi:hypothetical protein
MTIAGGCRCGAMRYTIALDVLPATYACHCRDCQTWSGSAFSQQFIIAESMISVSGPIEVYELTTLDRTSRQRFCATCHTRIFNTNTRRPGVAVVRAGTLDDSDQLDVIAHIWTSRKQPWVIIPAGVPTWPEFPPDLSVLARPQSG